MDNTVYERVANELEHRRRSERAGDRRASSWKWLADQLGVTPQVVSNWKNADVPASRYEALAAVLGWSLDRLVSGGSDEAVQPQLSPSALEIAVRIDALQQPGDLRLYRAAYMQISDVLDRITLPASRRASEPASPTMPAPTRRR